MTAQAVIDTIKGLRQITLETGCITRGAQSDYLATVPTDLLAKVTPELAKIFKEKDPNHVNNTVYNR